MISIQPIIPKKKLSPASAERELNRYLLAFANAVVSEMQKYPPARPWKGRTPKSGPRAGGRRTGNYGRNWRMMPTGRSIRIYNPIAYATYVGGRYQTANMKSRGWSQIMDVAAKHRKANLPKFSRTIWV